MTRWLWMVLCVGCGSVQAGPDAGQTDVLDGTLRNGCVVALHMEEPSWSGAMNEVQDDCGNDNPGTVVGQGSTTVASGAHGRAGSFSGDACIDIPDAEALHGTSGLTLSAWILPTKLNNGDGANGIISKRTGTGLDPEYSMDVWMENHVWVDLDGENNRFEGATTIVEKVWTQLTVVYDGTRDQTQRARVYVNGSLDVTKPEASATLTPYKSTLHVGCMPAPNASPPLNQNFIGELDEVVIWNRALSDAEIARWYANTKP